MTLLKSSWKTVAMLSVAIGLFVAGGAFADAYKATFTVSGSNGSIAAKLGTAGSELTSGEDDNIPDDNAQNLIITATPAANYEVDVWTLTIGGSAANSGDSTISADKTVLTVPTAKIIGDVVATVSFKAVTVTTTPEIYFSTQPVTVSGVVEGNVTSAHKLTSLATRRNLGANVVVPVPDTTIEYRWFNPTSSSVGNNDAAVSAWSKDGKDFQLPANIAAGPNYFYVRARSTAKKPDGTDFDLTASSVVTVTVGARPTVAISVQPVQPNAPYPVGTAVTALTVTAGVTGGTPGVVTYQWYRNTGNSSVGGVAVNGAATASYTPTGLKAGIYYYFCEVSNDLNTAAPVRSTVVRIEMSPTGTANGSAILALPAGNVVQVSDKTDTYTPQSATSTTKALKIATPSTAATLVSPALAQNGSNLIFEVIEIIYLKSEDNFSVNFLKSGTAGSNSLADQGVTAAGTYLVTFVVQSTNTTGSVYQGSRTVTYTVNRKQISTISTKSISPTTAAYDGTPKQVSITLADGSGNPLVEGTHYNVTSSAGDWVNAGAAPVIVEGIGNYAGTWSTTLTITKKVITVDTAAMSAAPGLLTKVYDGLTTVTADAGSLDVKFGGLVNANDLQNGVSYSVSGLVFDNASVGTNRVVSGTVKLDTTLVDGVTNMGRNYSFASGAVTAALAKGGVAITAKPLNSRTTDSVFFSYAVPKNRFYTGQPQGIGTVGFRSPLTSAGSVITVYYDKGQGAGPESTLPVAAGTYKVTLDVVGGSNFGDSRINAGNGVNLEDFVIAAAKTPAVHVTNKTDSANVTAVNAYLNDALTLRAIGFRPDSATIRNAANDADSILYYKSGTLSYLWFKQNATDATKYDTLYVGNTKTPVTTPTYTVTYTTIPATAQVYRVEATYSNPGVQVDTKVNSTDVTVTVNAERQDVAEAVITVSGSWSYTGVAFTSSSTASPSTITSSDLSVRLGSNSLTAGTDFTYDVLGEDAGQGLVTITGIGAYKGRASGTFDIARKVTVEGDLKYNPASATVQYNGAAQPITITPRVGEGLGAVNITYININDEENPDTLSAAPKNAGKYKTLIAIDSGKNYTALEEFERAYTITKRFAEKEDFNYTMPKNGTTPTAIVVTLKNPMGYTGTLTTLYTTVTGTNLTVVPTEEGSYAVKVRVGGDDNFGAAVVFLDSLVLDSTGKVGVLDAKREVPKASVTEVVTVAPVKVAATSFTAGPSPVSKNGAIKFFSAKALKSGTLYIFDANGNSVAKLSAKSASGEIASWNLKDKKGAAVTEGTYVVKGALTGKDGTKEKVSFPFSVVK